MNEGVERNDFETYKFLVDYILDIMVRSECKGWNTDRPLNSGFF